MSFVSSSFISIPKENIVNFLNDIIFVFFNFKKNNLEINLSKFSIKIFYLINSKKLSVIWDSLVKIYKIKFEFRFDFLPFDRRENKFFLKNIWRIPFKYREIFLIDRKW